MGKRLAPQRFIDACAGRGRYPIKFNGSIFTVPYPGEPGDADYPRWGPGYWWQNTRLHAEVWPGVLEMIRQCVTLLLIRASVW